MAVMQESSNVMQSLFRMGQVMAKQCGGLVTIVHTDQKDNSLTYTNSDSIWDQLIGEGLKLHSFTPGTWCRRIDVAVEGSGQYVLKTLEQRPASQLARKQTNDIRKSKSTDDSKRASTDVSKEVEEDTTMSPAITDSIKMEEVPPSTSTVASPGSILKNNQSFTPGTMYRRILKTLEQRPASQLARKRKQRPASQLARKRKYDIRQSKSTDDSKRASTDVSKEVEEDTTMSPAITDSIKMEEEPPSTSTVASLCTILKDNQRNDSNIVQVKEEPHSPHSLVQDDTGHAFGDVASDGEFPAHHKDEDAAAVADDDSVEDKPEIMDHSGDIHRPSSSHSNSGSKIEPSSPKPPSFAINHHDPNLLPSDFENTTDNTCPACKVTFNSKEAYMEHTLYEDAIMGEIQKVRMCGTCQLCSNPVRDHCDELKGKKRYVCCQCPARCTTFAGLKEHIDRHVVGKQFPCTICGASFYNKVSLCNHQILHRDKSFPCAECGSVLKNRYTYKVHMQMHKGKTFPCSLCDKVYSRACSLRKHTWAVHEGKRVIKTPIKKNKPIESQTSTNHKCDLCAELFPTAQQLMDHEQVHAGEKPYKCPICDEGFSQAEYVNKHVELVHGED